MKNTFDHNAMTEYTAVHQKVHIAQVHRAVQVMYTIDLQTLIEYKSSTYDLYTLAQTKPT